VASAFVVANPMKGPTMKQTHRAALAIAATAALCGPATAQDDASLRADTGTNAQVIGTGNFVANGRNTSIKVTPTQYLLCTEIDKPQEACAPIVARSTMTDIVIIPHNAPDGTPLIDFNFDPHSTRDLVNLANAVARFIGRVDIAADELTSPARGRANAPGSAAAAAETTEPEKKPKKCSDATTPGVSLTAAGESDACAGDGNGGNIPDAGTVIINAPYRSPDPLPHTDIHGDPVKPPKSGGNAGSVPVPVVVVPGPRSNDAPIIVPVPRLGIPIADYTPHLWDGCIVTPIGVTCANVGRRSKNDPNAIPPVPSAPPPLTGSLDSWWAQWWPFPKLDWCKLIGYGCVKANEGGSGTYEGNGSKLPPDTSERKRQQCDDHFAATLTYCEEVVEKFQKKEDLDVCFQNATDAHDDCIEAATGTRPSFTSRYFPPNRE
jgi:hypothetical protein